MQVGHQAIDSEGCLPDQRALVGMTQEPVLMHQGKMIGQLDIALRFPRLTDPPIVSALPFL